MLSYRHRNCKCFRYHFMTMRRRSVGHNGGFVAQPSAVTCRIPIVLIHNHSPRGGPSLPSPSRAPSASGTANIPAFRLACPVSALPLQKLLFGGANKIEIAMLGDKYYMDIRLPPAGGLSVFAHARVHTG